MAMKKNQRYGKNDQRKQKKKEAQRSRPSGLQEFLGLPPSTWKVVLAICLALVVATIGIRALIAPSAESPLTVEAIRQTPPPTEKVERTAPPSRELSPSERGIPDRADAPKPRDPDPSDATPGDDSQELVGIEVFPPLGTKPNLTGIIVPDDFELPPGYVRHYQTSDDGRQLEPILMFHPKRRPVDSQGNPIDVPDDRIVPPELAPEGLSVRMLQLPETKN